MVNFAGQTVQNNESSNRSYNSNFSYNEFYAT